MGIFDKIKNALFEEEYVEVEEKPKVKPIKKEKPKRDFVSEKPIAKKVILPERHESKVERVMEEPIVIEEDEDDKLIDVAASSEKSVSKFPMMDDNDFEMDDVYQPKIVKILDEELSYDNESKKSSLLYKGKKNIDDNKCIGPYGMKKTEIVSTPEYGAYEKKEDKSYFKPSPIISPIYGILDKNYKKEEIVNKREVRLTSSYSRENLSVDDVRRKAYGSLDDDIAQGVEKNDDSHIVGILENNKDNLLVDLSDENEKPKVSEITMGDAEEYFQDLGLEYNIDYKDSSRENNDNVVGKHAMNDEHIDDKFDVNKNKIDNETDIDTNINIDNILSLKDNDIEDNIIKNTRNYVSDISSDENDDDNLFDLIDSMYDRDN